MKKKSRYLSFLLILICLFSLLPDKMVIAAEEDFEDTVEAFAWLEMEKTSEAQIKKDNQRFDALLHGMTKKDRSYLADISYYQQAYGITEKQMKEIKKKVEKITASAKTDQARVQALFQWITKNIYYDYDILGNIVEGSQNAYQVFTSRRGVCDGYANLFDLCIKILGIPCLKIDGFTINTGKQSWDLLTAYQDGKGSTEPGLHAWNVIYTDGAWRYYDITWGTYNAYRDGAYIKGETTDRYYALSIEQMGKDHVPLMVWSRLPNEGFYYQGTKYDFRGVDSMEELEIQELPNKTGTSYTVPAMVADYPVVGFDYFSDIRNTKVWKQLKTLTFEEGISEIPDHACRDMPSLKKVVLPKSVKRIGYSAFYQCPKLQTITIPKKVTEIGGFAFASCSSLKKVKLPGKLKKIGEYAFYKTGLTSMTIPDSVTSLGNHVFAQCEGLKTLVLSASLKKVPAGTAYWCTSLTSVTMPKKATSIGKEAFYYCKSLTSIKIPNRVTTISAQAFAYCHALKKVTLGTKVEKLAADTFYNCVSIRKLIGTGEKPPKITKNFYLPAGAVIQAPAGQKKAYEKAFSTSQYIKQNNITVQEG